MITKKNWTMRAAVLMLALVLITSCFVGGTFAKYVTSKDGSDTARVAKFGVTVTANGSTFAQEYDEDKAAKTVAASENVVAPGTKGDMVSMTLSGIPEVAVKVTYEAAVTLNDKWTVNGDYYCPLKIKIGNDTLYGLDYDDADAFANAINNKINDYSKEYAPNQDLSAVEDDSLKVSWQWDFEGANGQTDEKDTALGDAAVNEGDAAKITIAVTTTVTQID